MMNDEYDRKRGMTMKKGRNIIVDNTNSKMSKKSTKSNILSGKSWMGEGGGTF